MSTGLTAQLPGRLLLFSVGVCKYFMKGMSLYDPSSQVSVLLKNHRKAKKICVLFLPEALGKSLNLSVLSSLYR